MSTHLRFSPQLGLVCLHSHLYRSVFRCSCSLFVSSSSRQSIHLAKKQNRRNSTPLPLVSWGFWEVVVANWVLSHNTFGFCFFYWALVFPSLLQSSPEHSAHCHQKALMPSLTRSLNKTTLSWCQMQSLRTLNPSLPAARIITLPTTRGWSSPILKLVSTATLHRTSPLLPKFQRCPRVQSALYRKGLLMLEWRMRSQDPKKTG